MNIGEAATASGVSVKMIRYYEAIGLINPPARTMAGYRVYRDETHRVLVTRGDRLGNVEQIAALAALGWQGPVSFEAFAPEVHQYADPKAELSASFDFIRDGLARQAA